MPGFCGRDEIGDYVCLPSMPYWVYVLTNRSGTLYVGVTNDLARRVAEHKAKTVPGFTSRYAVDRLVYCEEYPTVRDAIARARSSSKAGGARRRWRS